MTKQIAVIGSGSIGPDLAYGFASALAPSGAIVFLHDISETQLDKGLERIRGYVAKGLARDKLSKSAADKIIACLRTTTHMGDLANCSYILEAATENLDIKHKILAKLERFVSQDCLIGFATSGIPRQRIVANALHPDRCFVNHPFYPAWRSLPIELVASPDPVLSKRMYDLLLQLGKVPIVTGDVPCFAADDVFCNFECEAFRILADGVATVGQIDHIIDDYIGGGGPFKVADLTGGNALIVHCQELMAEDRADGTWFQPPQILLKQGNKPWYNKDTAKHVEYTEETANQVMERIYAVVLSRSLAIVEAGVCKSSDLDWLLRCSLGFNTGFLSLAARVGFDSVKYICETYAAKHPGFELPNCLSEGHLPGFQEHVTVSVDERGIAQVLVRRPEVVNALNAATIGELSVTFEALENNPAVKGIVFGGLGGGLAGADINELASLEDSESCVAMCAWGQNLTLLMERLSKPIVAAIDGPALGGGAELCMAAWARVVSKRAVIGQPEVNLGIIPGYGGTQRLPRLVGLKKASILLRTGQIMSAQQACDSGWATGEPVCDAFAVARDLLLEHIAGRRLLSPLDSAPLEDLELPFSDIGHHSWKIDTILREVLSQGLTQPLSEGLKREANGFGRCRQTRDMNIGMANFISNGPKVPAVFIGE